MKMTLVMQCIRTLIALSCVALSVATALSPDRSAGSESGTAVLESCVAAWQERENAFRAVDIAWTETQVVPTRLFGGFRRSEALDAQASAVPSETISLDYHRTLLLYEDKLRYTDKGKYWNGMLGRLTDSSHTWMWDGTKAGAFAEIEGAEFISGSVVPDNTIQQIANVRFALTSFRPYSEMAIPYAQSMEVMPHVGDIDGARCRILSFGVEPSGRFRVWVDPGRHYLPLRVEQVKGNATLAQYDIEYRERSAGEWLPSGASTVLPREDGFVLLRSRAVVTSCEKLASVNESAFVIDFPVGARVHDQVDDTCYILRPDGERRVILPSELGASYESLVNTDTGHARSYRTGTWWKSVLWGLALLACVAVTMGFVWRWRARAAARKS